MRKRHIVLALLVVLGIITFLDRMCIAVAGPRMQADLGISTERWGWVLGAFILSYGIFEIPVGAWGDRWGHRNVLSRIVLWWSVFACLTGAASGFVSLLMIRFLFGAGEAGGYPNIAGVISRWFPGAERARAQGFVWGAGRFGAGITPLLVVPLMQAWGWRAAFWIAGATGFVWVAVWRLWYRNRPAEQPGITPQELQEIQSQPAPEIGHSIPWGLLARSRQLWLISGMYALYVWGSWFYFSWLHTYLIKGRGFTESEMGMVGSLPYFMGACGNLTGGFLSDYLARRHGLRNGRRWVGTASLATTSLLFLATALSTGKVSAIVLLAVGLFVLDFLVPTAWAVCLDVGRQHAGAVTGVMSTAGQAGGFVSTVLFGYIAERAGSYDAPLLMISLMVMVSAILFWSIDASRPLEAPVTGEKYIPAYSELIGE